MHTHETALTQFTEANGKWGASQEKPFEYLKSIRQPTLVVSGHKDIIIYTANSFILQQNIPNAQLILYPDASHGSMYQYPELFLAHVSLFLSGYGDGTGQAPSSATNFSEASHV